MKKNLLYAAAIAMGLPILSACKRELNVNPQNRIPVENFYKTEADAFAGLVSVYDRFAFQAGGLYDKAAICDVAGDDQQTGGGSSTDINDLQITEHYTLNPTTGPQSYLWSRGFTGIYRANVLLSKLPGVSMDAAKKARFAAETKVMRAAFYFDLVTFFESIPLLEGTLSIDSLYTVSQTTPDKIYAYVEKDLNEAIPDLPLTVPAASEGGRLTQGSAKALLGKVLLFEKKWQAAADQFNPVNGPTPGGAASTYGYKLVPVFADLFKSTNKFNTESVIEFVHSSKSSGNWVDAGASEGNLLCITTGPRSYARLNNDTTAPDFISGYGFLIFSEDFAKNVMFGDPRYTATISNVDSLKKAGKVTYSESYNGKGYFLKKFIGLNPNKAQTIPELNFAQDEYEIRLADTYLMEAEALMNAGASVGAGSRALTLINAVRARVGLAALTTVTQDAIEKERRLELAGEGQRFLDLIRWGKAATMLAFKGFVAGRNNVFPIPQAELDNTKLVQNKEWK